jgi:hypothetical protein
MIALARIAPSLPYIVVVPALLLRITGLLAAPRAPGAVFDAACSMLVAHNMPGSKMHGGEAAAALEMPHVY